jgi:DNA (cytosine-5)-methyltransferase 1
MQPVAYDSSADAPLPNGKWPYAAWCVDGVARASAANATPVWADREPLARFLRYPTKPLSARAAAGFLKRTRKGSLRFPPGFLDAVEAHMAGQQPQPPEFIANGVDRADDQLGLFDAEAA